ncbi:MAG: hypothetical protein ABL949_04405 [Fimbriimonadaceae bacterium]
MEQNEAELIQTLTNRYAGADLQALTSVIKPVLIPIKSLDKTIIKLPGQAHWRATFSIDIGQLNDVVVTVGRTGKFVPAGCGTSATWRELAKGRIIEINQISKVAIGEVYLGRSSKTDLQTALGALTKTDLWEVDQFGAGAKLLSALTEYYLVEHGRQRGYNVIRMPEDFARHLGTYRSYDFEFVKDGLLKRVEAKSIWGTDTRYARLIHSKSTKRPAGDPSTWSAFDRATYYPTSSCKFATQDIFAVSLFLRTGNIKDFAFARSVSKSITATGLPFSPGNPDHVHQNPPLEIGDGTWFASIDEVW